MGKKVVSLPAVCVSSLVSYSQKWHFLQSKLKHWQYVKLVLHLFLGWIKKSLNSISNTIIWKEVKNLPLVLICSINVADTSDEVTFWESMVEVRVSFLSAAQNKFATNNNVRVIKVRSWKLILSLLSSFRDRHR